MYPGILFFISKRALVLRRKFGLFNAIVIPSQSEDSLGERSIRVPAKHLPFGRAGSNPAAVALLKRLGARDCKECDHHAC